MTAVLREREPRAAVNLRGLPQRGFPTEPNTWTHVGGQVVLWLGPDEWLALGGTEADYLDAAAAVDVSASRIAFELAGADAAGVLAQGCSLDLDAVKPGCCAQTLLARAPVILLREAEETWLVLARVSYANYVRAWLEDALTSLPASR